MGTIADKCCMEHQQAPTYTSEETKKIDFHDEAMQDIL